VSVYDAVREEKLVELGRGEAPVQAAAFSPLGAYLQVYHKPAGEGDKNLRLYSLPSGALAFSLAQKKYTRDSWPSLQWSDDESVLARVVSNEVQLFSPSDFTAPPRRLRVPGVTAASLSPGAAPVVAAFVPEAKGAPASLRICALPLPGGEAVTEPAPLARRSFFRVTYVKFRWNCSGSALLVLATADVDATNQSYFGESSLHFLRTDGSLDGSVQLPKEGPVHDVAWSPRGTEFIAVYGFMPARATLFSTSSQRKLVSEAVPARQQHTPHHTPKGS